MVGFAGGLAVKTRDIAAVARKIARARLQGEVHAEERHNARVPDAGEEHRTDDEGEEEDVHLAVEAEGLRVFGGLAVGDVLPEHHAVDREVDGEQDAAGDEPGQKHVLGRPEEGDALQEPEKERGVAQRREAPAHVRHEEDEEDEGVDLALAAFVRG